ATTFGPRLGAYAGQIAKESLVEGAKGYLVGSAERDGHPERDAFWWAAGHGVLSPAGKLLGKLRVWGDQPVTEEILSKIASDYLAKAPATQVTPVATAMAGSPEQKISAALMKAMNEETGGKFFNMPLAAKQEVLKQLATKYPELAKNAGWLDQHLTEM